MKKTYQLNVKCPGAKKGVSLNVNGESKMIVFESGKGISASLLFTTSDKAVQKALEDSPIGINLIVVRQEATEDDRKETVKDIGNSENENPLNVFDGVNTFKEAREILTAEPYNIPVSHLGNGDKILEKAQELGLSFPKLNVG